MEEDLKRLDEIKETLQRGARISPVTVRDFLSWFGAQRRGPGIVLWIKRNLEGRGLGTEPDFESAYIDSPIEFFLTKTATRGTDAMAVGSQAQTSDTTHVTKFGSSDPTYRISKLAAENNPPISVSPDANKREAVTLMLTNDFSQLPVMTSDREVKGVISWMSIGTRLALGKDGSSVRDLMDRHYEIRADASIFQAIPIIVQEQCVLMRGVDNRITGIVTATDLSR
jgi:CBS domain-containing protein